MDSFCYITQFICHIVEVKINATSEITVHRHKYSLEHAVESINFSVKLIVGTLSPKYLT